MSIRKYSMGYLQLIQASNTFTHESKSYDSLYKLYLPYDERPHGLLLPHIVERIPWTRDFKILHDARRVEVLDSSMGCDTSTAVSRALKEVIEACQQKDLFSMLRNRDTEWRAIAGAKYPVRILRYAQPLFGIVGQGVHLTAYVQCPDGLKIWVARRSSTIDAFPGMLDNTAAGSVPADLTPLEAMIEEAREEASLSPQLIRRNIRASGALSYVTLTEASHGEEQGLIIPDVIYVYDLELEEDALPKPHDNEVQQFYLMDTDEIKTRLTNGEFKPNCAIVMIDFFVRNGIITAENERDYVEICMHLHRSLPFGTATY